MESFPPCRSPVPAIMRILVVDDEPTSRLIAQMVLRKLGYECETVTDGLEAWEAFCAARPDVIISDWMMPGLTGLELCRKVRDHTSGGHTYFIMVSGLESPEEIIEGMDAGADDYLTKPLDHQVLRMRMIAAARVTSLHLKLVEQRTQLEVLNKELAESALRDALTGLGNRRALDLDLDQMGARATRYGHSYCIALLDVDCFKSYNDTYGHQAGDRVLQTAAAHLLYQARGGDAIYRYGGEKFLCVFPEQSLSKATVAVERMRIGVEQLAIPHAGNSGGVVTFSAGLAMLNRGHSESVHEVVHRADEALYRAKNLGRNRVEPPAMQPSANDKQLT